MVRAAALYKQACAGGHMKGCYNLGVDYDSGEGVPKDVVRAAALYKQACDGGYMVFFSRFPNGTPRPKPTDRRCR